MHIKMKLSACVECWMNSAGTSSWQQALSAPCGSGEPRWQVPARGSTRQSSWCPRVILNAFRALSMHKGRQTHTNTPPLREAAGVRNMHRSGGKRHWTASLPRLSHCLASAVHIEASQRQRVAGGRFRAVARPLRCPARSKASAWRLRPALTAPPSRHACATAWCAPPAWA